MEYTFEQNTGGFNKIHYATAETAEAMADLMRSVLSDNYTVSVELEGSQYTQDTIIGRQPARELWVTSIATGAIMERFNAGLVANMVNLHGVEAAKLSLVAELLNAQKGWQWFGIGINNG